MTGPRMAEGMEVACLTRTRVRWRRALAAVASSALGFTMVASPVAVAAGPTGSPALTVILQSGQAAPGTGTTFTGFGDPSINGQGLVAFQGLLAAVGGGDASIGLFAGVPGTVAPIILQGQPAPGTSGVFAHPPGDFNGSGAFPYVPRLDAAGDVAYAGDYAANGAQYYANAAGVFLDGSAAAFEGSPTPDGATFHFDFDYEVPPVVSPGGTIALLTQVCPCVYPGQPSSGIYLWNGGQWQTVVRQGQTVPGGAGIFEPQSVEDPMGFSPPAVNDAGQVAFAARVSGTSDGLYLSSGGTLRPLVATGGALPDGRKEASVYDVQHGPALNAGGQVAALVGTSDDGQGVYLFGPSGSSLVLHTGDPDPAGSGNIVCAVGDPGLGDDGTVAFTATLVPPDVPGCGTQKVLYVGHPGALQEAASVTLPTQESVGKTTDLGPDEPYVSPQGWVAFIQNLAGAQTLSVWDGHTARRVAGTGDTIGGWTITDLDLAGEDTAGATALNAAGQLVFRAFAGTQNSQSELVLASLSGTPPAAALPGWLGQTPAAPSGGAGQSGGGSAGGSGQGDSGTAGSGPKTAGPTVTAVSPSSGSDWGGDTVTITGTGFTAGTTVQFGPYNDATVDQVSADGTTMTVTTPPDLDGPVDVVVTTAVGAGATLGGAFSFQPPGGGAQP